MLDNGFKRGSVDKTLFIKEDSHHILIAQIYVDDIVLRSTSSTLVDPFSKSMSNEFEMSMVGELSFLGLQIKQCESGIFVSQSKYARKLLEEFGMTSTKHSRTPMSPCVKLSKDLNGKDVNETLYKSMISNLLYLIASRPNIAYSVGACAHYQSKSKESHIHSVKRIMKYVSGTVDFGIWLSKDTNTNLVGCSDADWVGCANDRKVQLEGASLLRIIWSLGTVKSRLRLLCRLLKLNILLLEVVALNFLHSTSLDESLWGFPHFLSFCFTFTCTCTISLPSMIIFACDFVRV